jgi:hypothetical protein
MEHNILKTTKINNNHEYYISGYKIVKEEPICFEGPSKFDISQDQVEDINQ